MKRGLNYIKKIICVFAILIFAIEASYCQNSYFISGKVMETGTDKPMANATVHLKGSNFSALTKMDGTFKIHTDKIYDSLTITSVGFNTVTLALAPNHTTGIEIKMQSKADQLQTVVIGISKKPAKSFMQKVIDQKNNNNPARFRSYSYQRYTRNELDIDNIDFEKSKGSGLKSLMLKTYSGFDTTAKENKSLPVYFDETLANVYHSVSPNINDENILAKKTLGLKTDYLFSRLDKFYFHFNIYNDWLPIFSQTYVSPLNSNAFSYYKFFEGDSTVEEGETIQQIRFTPIRSYEKAFEGLLYINKNSLAVENVIMHLDKTTDLNFIKNITYSEDYSKVYDSASDKMVYMPYKYTSEVKFENGLDLLGIPAPENKKAVKFIFRNTTVTAKLNLNTGEPSVVIGSQIRKEKTANWDKPDEYWDKARPDPLTDHEKNIYSMVDSLKQNARFQRDVKIVAFAGTGYWDFGNSFRIGPYSSFLSRNSIEGWRFRLGFWTMPGISKKLNFYGYGAYGTKDQKIKGMLGVKYVWDAARWTKTSFSYGSDYDFIIDHDDELDKDNIINTLLRKHIPFTRTHVKEYLLKHEQYLNNNWMGKLALDYKELDPVFDFKYRPINPAIDKPYDSVFLKKLPVAEARIGFRYAHHESVKILNYDRIPLVTYSPILTFNYAYGLEFSKAEFTFHKVSASIEQKLRLPPKSMLYYKLEVGKVFGTLPYLLLNIPAGNEYYVASKYQFNTMSPYEFAADRYVSLHTRFYLGGVLFDKIPLLRKLGWRERFSFNSYWGDMTQANIAYNKGSNFNLINKAPFMEASAGIENIFHVLSIEYYKRLNYLNNPYAIKDGIYLGITLSL
ncbi:MAG: carboxypeptidase-like regulatory domain-containing protein [Bacteroidetes bacterium]|nr:carboxypeptidase-like regulatory domain-containing protein [Bacteroidota bacterium]